LAGNLRDRLKRIQQVKQAETVIRNVDLPDISAFTEQGWVTVGHLTLRREVTAAIHFALPKTMPEAAGLLMPGIRAGTDYQDMLFFDLETSGLSTGAGTVAFLAAFGRLDRAECLRITQYLLLDYPGENDFIEALLAEFTDSVTMISYNGKCFDSQILKTRCLMNGIVPPEYRHADLLHPARRLWKRLLPDCSQATIETGILGIDRTGDIPGAFAPEIWFSFLRHRETGPLLGIVEHNRRDIAGLAAIFSALTRIADNPFEAAKDINFDLEALALRWYERSRYEPYTPLCETGQKLLRFAAEDDSAEGGHPHAALVYALSLLKAGQRDDGRKWLLKTASAECPPPPRISALRALAIDSEHRLKDPALALSFTEQALEILPPDSSRRADFERRQQRLQWKMV
jgi:uncharacterized protein YprB with RNaseH-like and TPR domain